MDGYLQRGERNRLIFAGEAVAILRRLEELRQQEGIPIRQAADRLRGELSERGDLYILLKPEVKLALLQEVIREAYHERDQWREYALALQAVLPPELKWLTAAARPVADDRRLN